ncbi:phosphoribosylamine--glycine ligase [Buchananella hordeovulneris]|uniref:phosphoribosylamine--glycine ligase n=1 Tax=Buchananella hordeovulneris TaxID=52770 RepID=UPI000F5D625A|nr:phosphoribosylamine--glycine ligase [Buchananella hordeovulneris]RRD42499.1 phosphoribosylamine--glycine ligase [Buchananella hordeovulneris]
MKILLLGSGGREHALARALSADPATTLLAAPGNPGIAAHAELLDLDPLAGQAVAAAAQAHQVDLVVVGPEAPLVAGVADAVRAVGIPVFGPSRAAAQLEGSKAFAKEVMDAAGVPTAQARVCSTLAEVEAALWTFGPPHVVKDDGLAAGKGVVVTDDWEQARAHAAACLGLPTDAAPDAPAAPGRRVVIEDFLDGPEVSLFCVCDGERAVPLAAAQDFKRAFDGDAGPNTGGMGAYSPLPWAPPGLAQEVVDTVAQPVLAEMARRGTPFVGLLYCGLALTARGLRVVEFNVRFGDPETQVVLARLRSSLPELLYAAATGALADLPAPVWDDGAAVTVVIAAPGYPGEVTTGGTITGVEAAGALPATHVIHAGTRLVADQLVAVGGRVLCVVGQGADVPAARAAAYAAVDAINLPDSHHRKDIAARI